jgi:hypothetical protein
MNPGEYIGKDGRRYRWRRRYDDLYSHELKHELNELNRDGVWLSAFLVGENWEAARDAFDALIKSQKDEGRRIPLACFGGRFELVLRRELGKSEIRMASDGTVAYPTGNDVSVFAAAAYQKGHKDGLTERGDS